MRVPERLRDEIGGGSESLGRKRCNTATVVSHPRAQFNDSLSLLSASSGREELA